MGLHTHVFSKSLNPGNWSLTTLNRVNRLLSEYPVIDGHNDFPMGLRYLLKNDLNQLNFDHDLTQEEPWASYWANHIDLPRMRQGKMGGQFWSAFISCNAQYADAVQLFLEQVDIIRQLVAKYPNDLMWAVSTQDIEEAWKVGKIASMIGVESGHAIGSSLPILRTLYRMGARYMTLTHSCNTPWAEAAQMEDGGQGLSDFGEKVVMEMNRLGMMVDLAHVSKFTMEDALRVSSAPVIFSHSGARGVNDHVRNVPDEILLKVKENGGVVMVNFYSCYVISDCDKRNATIMDVVRHIEHIRSVAGVEHVGIGGDFNGVEEFPEGLQDVSQYPNLFEALIDFGENWDDHSLALLAGGNLLRVLRQVEASADQGGGAGDNSWIEEAALQGS